MKLRLALASGTLLVLAVVATPSSAQHRHDADPPATSSTLELADGEVRRIDPVRGTVVLRHGEIKAIGMGPMTMSFKFKDPAMATGLQVGDRVQFLVERQGNDFVITQIRKTKES
jgi:Cu/Ag efflux protein CusF